MFPATRKTAIAISLLFAAVSICYAVEDDFGSASKVEGKHFTIYYATQLDIPSLLQQLNIQPSDKILAGESVNKDTSYDELGMADMVDTLFMRVCDILDMHLYSFQGNIKICKDSEHLNRIYKNLFDKNIQAGSFYVYSLNTIYISKDTFKRGILGHEIAHAIMSCYFVVQPSVKIQEVLAGYVEYQLR